MKNLVLLSPAAWLEKPLASTAVAPMLLTALQALWHPAFLVDAEELPSRRDVDNLPLAEDMVLSVLKSDLDATSALIRKDFAELRATKLVIEAKHVGSSGLLDLLAPLQLPCPDTELLLDFFALGYAYHGLDVLFEQMGHDNPLSQDAIIHTVQEAAGAFLEEKLDETRSLLRNAFEILTSTRCMVYPATISIIDFGFAFPGMTVSQIQARMEWDAPINLILTAQELEQATAGLTEEDSPFLSTRSSNLELLSGIYDARPLGLLPLESRLWQLSHCMDVFEKHVGSLPTNFAARTHALTADLPQLLMKFQYRYALHGAFDGGKLPYFRSPKLHWTARDGSVIEALARVAWNVGDPGSAFSVFAELGRTTMTDRSATLVLAHWIHEGAPWYQFLLRAHRYANVFGNFQTFNDFFMSSSMPDRPTTTRNEEYATNALAIAASRADPDPISRWQRGFELRGKLDATRTLAAMVLLAGGTVTEGMNDLEDAVEKNAEDARERLVAIATQSSEAIERLILKDQAGANGYLVLNPCGFARRLGLELPGAAKDIPLEYPVRAVQAMGEKSAVVVDAPGFGYSWIGCGGKTPPKSDDKKEVALASGRRLRNEFIELEIDAKTGGIRGIWDIRDRYSRLGQQLAHNQGSKAVCKRLDITAAGPAFGEIITEGELLDASGKRLHASFQQTVRLWIGRPVVEISVHLDQVVPPTGVYSEDYLACRWAWPDEKTVVRSANGYCLEPTQASEIESPQVIQLRERSLLTDIVMHGLPFHRRGSLRMLDSLLVVAGESQRDFKFTVGFNLAHPWSTVCDGFQAPIIRKVEGMVPIAGQTGWLARIADSNVLCSSMVPFEDYSPGVRMRLLETTGTSTRTELRFARRASVAELTDCRGQLIFGLHATEDGLPVDFSPYELQQIKVMF